MDRILRITPSPALRPYIASYTIDEKIGEGNYKVFPGASLVAGFQYKGHLSVVANGELKGLATTGITGLSDTYKTFGNSDNIGSVLVHFTETGVAAFFDTPAHELFNGSFSLKDIAAKRIIEKAEDELRTADGDQERVAAVERLFHSLLRPVSPDKMVSEAVRNIKSANGNVRMAKLANDLNISVSQLEKRFRAAVGATPKKFASIVRFNAIISEYKDGKDLHDLAFHAGFFDQAHFINSFKAFTGLTARQFLER